MSVRIMSLVWGHARAEGNALLVLLALADFADDDGRCWPAMASIAKKARVSARGARGIIRRLEASGLLICESSKGRSSNRYRITINPEAASGSRAVNPEDDAGLNPEAASALTPSNPEDSDTQPGSPLPPNHQEPSIEKSLKKDSRKSSKSKKPVTALSPILGADMAGAVVEHRQRIGWPLTVRAAEMLARQFAKYHDPPAGAEKMLHRGWRGFEAEWMDNDQRNRRGKTDGRPSRTARLVTLAHGQDRRTQDEPTEVQRESADAHPPARLLPAPDG